MSVLIYNCNTNRELHLMWDLICVLTDQVCSRQILKVRLKPDQPEHVLRLADYNVR